MVGDQVKYDPAWVKSVPEIIKKKKQDKSSSPGKRVSQKKKLEAFCVEESSKSFAQAFIFEEDPKLEERLKNLKKARRTLLKSTQKSTVTDINSSLYNLDVRFTQNSKLS